jgi:hypothetical protein
VPHESRSNRKKNAARRARAAEKQAAPHPNDAAMRAEANRLQRLNRYPHAPAYAQPPFGAKGRI